MSHRFRSLSPGTLVILVVAVVLPSLPWDLGANAATYLTIGRRLLLGQVPYVDFIDTNPPLIFYLNAIPAGLHLISGITLRTAFRICVSALLLSSFLMIRPVLLRNLPGRRFAETLFYMLLTLGIVMCLDPRVGEREHLFALLYLPYLFIRWSRENDVPVPRMLALVAGLLAGAGACIKPHFLPVALAVEVWLLLSHRGIDRLLHAECVTFLVAGSAYALHFLIVPAAMRQALFSRLIPSLLEHYVTFRGSLPPRHVAHLAAYLLTGIVVPWLGMASASDRVRRLYRLLGIFTVSSVLFVYLGQERFRGYHAIPAQIGAMFLLALMTADLAQRMTGAGARGPGMRPDSRWVPLSLLGVVLLGLVVLRNRGTGSFGAGTALVFTAGALWILMAGRRESGAPRSAPGGGSGSWMAVLPLAGLLVVGAHLSLWPRHSDPARGPVETAIRSHTSRGDTVLILTTLLRDAYPMLMDIGRVQGSRYLAAFPFAFSNHDRHAVAGVFPYPRRSELEGEEARFIGELGQDIMSYSPKMIFVSRRTGAFACPKEFIMSEYLRHLGFFRHEMAGYRSIGEVGDFEAYLREDLPAASGSVTSGAARPGASSRDRATPPCRTSPRRRPASAAGDPA